MKYRTTTDISKSYVVVFVAAEDLEAAKHKLDAKIRDFSTLYSRTSTYAIS